MQVRSEIVFDPLQNARLCLLGNDEGQLFELVEGEPVKNFIKRSWLVYHTCWETYNLEEKVEELLSEGFVLITDARPAVLFEKRRVIFLQGSMGFVELLERKL